MWGESLYRGENINIDINNVYVKIFLFVYDMKKGDCSFDL